MAQQTAMQMLIAWGDEMLLKHPQKILSFAEAIDKAEELLQMEKEQIIKTAIVCHFEGVRQSAKTSEGYIIYGEQYYNETYNK